MFDFLSSPVIVSYTLKIRIFFISLPFLFTCVDEVPAQNRPHVETGKIMVKFRQDAAPVVESRMKSLSTPVSGFSVLKTGLKSFDKISQNLQVGSMKRVFPDAGKYEEKHRKYGLHLWYEITIPENLNPDSVATIYGWDESVAISEPRYKIRSLAMPSSSALFETPSDPDFPKQWNFNNTGQTGGVPGVDIRLPEAWEAANKLGVKNHDVIVAVIDGGVDYNHEDIKQNMWINEAELNGKAKYDDDGNGYEDDIYGYNFFRQRQNAIGTIMPEDHATHVAGTIAAVTDNRTGVSGILGNPEQGYRIRVMNVQIFSGDRSVSSINEAFVYAADNGAVISQNSWGYEDDNSYNQSDIEAIDYFINEAGRDEVGNPRPGTPMTGGIVIFAAGNDRRDAKWYPAYFDNVIAVAAVNHYGKRAWYSNYGNWVDISAPGGDTREKEEGGIFSTSYSAAQPNHYEYMQGTSMACPHVSGVAALILSVYGDENFTPDILRARLLHTATPLDEWEPNNASRMGSGLLNAAEALAPGGTPSAITDLAASQINHVSGELRWSVPDVSNEGKNTSFIVACATEMITEDNFDRYARATVRTNLKTGDMQTYTLAELQPSTLYYVAVRSIGNLGDRADISNIISLATGANRTPELINTIPDITLISSINPTTIDLSRYISDPDGDKLSYTYTLDSRSVVRINIQGDSLTTNPLQYGQVSMILTASDSYGGSVTVSFNLITEAMDKLFIYPNPAQNILRYSFIVKNAASVSVRIVNTVGKMMYQTPAVTYEAGTYSEEINLSGWVSGMYFLQYIKNGKPTHAKKFIKQ
jgi:subtilisin family serine protease